MKKIIILSLLTLLTISCSLPQSCCGNESTYYPPTYYQPTKIIVVKHKPHKTYKPKTNKRHVKVKINKRKNNK